MSKKKVFFIAEAGVNHNGSLELAKKLVDAASMAQADAVKFQTFKAETLVSRHAKKSQYQIKNYSNGQEDTQLEMLKKLELPYQDHQELIDYCRQKEIQFLSTPFDLESIDFLVDLGLETLKIPSGEITNLPYLKKMGKTGKKLILSTGISTLEEIGQAIKIITKAGTPLSRLTVLHCNTEYPTPFEDVNLKAMNTIARHFNVEVGYSDHTLGIEVPIAAVALGATVIEKHFTLDRSLPGPDHLASATPQELKAMIKAIRHIELALGSSDKKPSPSELKNLHTARKSIVAKRDIGKGEVLSEDNITVKRPGNGISPMQWDEVLGLKACRDFEKDEFIETN